MDDTEASSMIVKNSEASNSYCGVTDRRWLLPAIFDKQQKRPISTLTTGHKTCMITGMSRKYPICPIFSKVMLKFTENFSMTFAENRTYGVPEFAGTEVNRYSGKLKGLSGYLQNHYPRIMKSPMGHFRRSQVASSQVQHHHKYSSSSSEYRHNSSSSRFILLLHKH